MTRLTTLALAAAVFLSGCEGFKEAMTAHVDVAASAGSQELSVTRLGDMLGAIPSSVPLEREIARTIADVWVNYQLLGIAAARGDSLNSVEVVDEALSNEIASMKAQQLRDSLAEGWRGDTNVTEAVYAQGRVLSAQHILFQTPPNLTPQQVDSVRRRAESIRARATAQNFAQLARQYTQDEGSKESGGMYPAFPPGQMIADFDKAITALQPGEIGPLLQTQFGFHIMRRPTLAEVRTEFGRAHAQLSQMAAESTYRAGLERAGDVTVSEKGVATAREVAQSPEAHRDDRTVIASSDAGDLTAQRLATFIRTFPNPQQQQQLRQMIAQSPDSVVSRFMRELVGQDLIVREADRANVEPDSADLANLRASFGRLVATSWQRLGVDPKTLADSAKTEDERERLAGERVERYLDRLLRSQAEYIMIPEQLERLLRSEYRSRVVAAGLDRAIERAQIIRAATDSAQAAQPTPPSAVPVPGQQSPPAGRGTPPSGGATPPPPGDDHQ
jgi:hypothetical protein